MSSCMMQQMLITASVSSLDHDTSHFRVYMLLNASSRLLPSSLLCS